MRILAAVKRSRIASRQSRVRSRPLPVAPASRRCGVAAGCPLGVVQASKPAPRPRGAGFQPALWAALLALLTLPVLADPQPLLLQTLSGQECTATLSPAGATVYSETFTGHLTAGANEIICWGPHLPVKADTLRLAVPTDLRVLHWQDEPALGGRRWTVRAPREGDYRLTVSSDLAQLTGKFSYRLAWQGDQAELRLRLAVTNALPQSLALQIVAYQPVANAAEPGAAPPPPLTMAGPLLLLPGTEHRRQIAALPGLFGETVYEYDGGPVREYLELFPTHDQITALVSLPPGDVTVEFPNDAQRQPLAVGALPAPANSQLVLPLGDTRDLVVRRTLLAQRKEALEFDKLGRLSGFDLVEDCCLEVTNYTAVPAHVRLWETLMAQWELEATPRPATTNGGRACWEVMPGPGETAVVRFTLTKHTGTRADSLP